MLCGSAMATCYNLLSFTLTKATSSMTNAICASTTKVLLISVAAGLVERDDSPLNVLATIGFFGATAAYVRTTLAEQAARAPPSEPSGKGAPRELARPWLDAGRVRGS